MNWTKLIATESHGILLVGRKVLDGLARIVVSGKEMRRREADEPPSQMGGERAASGWPKRHSLRAAPISALSLRTGRGAPSGSSHANG